MSTKVDEGRWTMGIRADIRKSWDLVARPDVVFFREKAVVGYWPVARWFLLLSLILAVLTPVVNWFGIPSNIIHAGSNAQMDAYVWAPSLEVSTGISRYIWVCVLTYVGNLAKLPVVGLLFHAFAKILRGKGSKLDSFKVAVYSTSPMLLFGWIPFFGLLSGLWVGYLYILALNKLHDVSFGPAIALVNLLIGLQLVWAFLFGWFGSSIPWTH